MTKEFKDCLKRRKIMEFDRAPELVPKELAEAVSDLNSAKTSFKDGNFKWAIIQSYYSMFHSARALIYSRGYRERSHHCLIIALRSLFVAQGLLDAELLESLQIAKRLRETADYYGEFSRDASEQLIKDAGQFLKIANKAAM